MTSELDENDFNKAWWQHPALRNALASGLIAGAGFVAAQFGLIPESIENLFYWIAIPLGGYHWGREGLEKLFRQRVIGIEILMLVATVACGILGLWGEAAALVFLYGAADGVEELTYARTRHAIRALLDLAPKEARVLRNGQEISIAAEDLVSGDVFVVRPGESIATDGIIKSGTSSVNESAISGESIPVDKKAGQKVFAASINCQGALIIEAKAAFADNTLSKIIHLVEEAQEQKSKTQRWIERFGNIYSPAVLGASLLLLVVPWLLGWDFMQWSVRAVVLLVAAAPCALVMSMPVAMAAGISAAGKRGILIKGGAHLEHLGAIRVVAFDKTGTLTLGKPTVTNIITASEITEQALLSLAAGLESFSEHPLARAILDAASAQNLVTPVVDQFEALSGAGVTGVIQGQKLYLGNPDLFAHMGTNAKHFANSLKMLQEEGKTVVLVGTREKVMGLIALRDNLREGVPEMIHRLHAFGIRTAMLTGDNTSTAIALAKQAGIEDVHANLKPEKKVAVIQLLEKQYGAVLMVGDGINDAPALAAATCGVAMGAIGSDAAIEAADIALMADDLNKVLEAIQFGRKARRVSSQNLIFSILILIVLIPLALLGLLNVAIAVFAHEASELLAVANSLRVARIPKLTAK